MEHARPYHVASVLFRLPLAMPDSNRPLRAIDYAIAEHVLEWPAVHRVEGNDVWVEVTVPNVERPAKFRYSRTTPDTTEAGFASSDVPYFTTDYEAVRVMETALFARGLGDAYLSALVLALCGTTMGVTLAMMQATLLVRATAEERCQAALFVTDPQYAAPLLTSTSRP